MLPTGRKSELTGALAVVEGAVGWKETGEMGTTKISCLGNLTLPILFVT